MWKGVPIYKFRPEEEGYTMYQLFNCDETGLNLKMLQDTTLADGSIKSARGFKVSK